VEVPLSDVQQTYDRVFAEIRTHVRVPGFRPGKFPRALAEKRFQSLMAQEAVQNLVPKYFDEALKQHELRPATEPRFQNLLIDKAQPLKFDVEFEIFPSFYLLPASEFKLDDKPIALDPEQVEQRIAEIRRSRATLEDKGAAPAETGDSVTFDFEGRLDGAPFAGGTGKDQRIEIGASQYLKDFDAQMAGMTAGQTKIFDLTFPADYGDAKIAGKTVQFTVTAHQVNKKIPAALAPELFKEFGGAETEEAFRGHIRQELQDDQERTQVAAHQRALADQLREKYTFEVPESSVERLMHRFEHELERADPEALKDPAKLEELKARRKEAILGDLRLNFVVDLYARKHDVQVDPKHLRMRFMVQAYQAGQNPSELIKTPVGEQMLEQARQQMLAEKVLGHLVFTVLGKSMPPEYAPGAPPDEPGQEEDDPARHYPAEPDHAGHDDVAHDDDANAGHEH
jgi:trigger factor